MTTTYQDITLVSGSTTITLPGEMQWIDRRSRSLVAANYERAASGANIIEEFQLMGGQPITLVADGAGGTWIDQATVDAISALADAVLSSPMTLTYNDGTTYTVRFRNDGNTPAVDAKELFKLYPHEDDHPHSLTLRLMQASL